jgi:hypothetical protein
VDSSFRKANVEIDVERTELTISLAGRVLSQHFAANERVPSDLELDQFGELDTWIPSVQFGGAIVAQR